MEGVRITELRKILEKPFLDIHFKSLNLNFQSDSFKATRIIYIELRKYSTRRNPLLLEFFFCSLQCSRSRGSSVYSTVYSC